MITTFGVSLSVPMMGAVYDSTGSYAWASVILGVLAVVAAICLVGAFIVSKRAIKT
jgi:hypothetical protein